MGSADGIPDNVMSDHNAGRRRLPRGTGAPPIMERIVPVRPRGLLAAWRRAPRLVRNRHEDTRWASCFRTTHETAADAPWRAD